MNDFSYRVTLNSGDFAFPRNGYELDRLIRDRLERVKTIEVVPKEEAEDLRPNPDVPVAPLAKLIPHADGDYSYCCGRDYCRCMQ